MPPIATPSTAAPSTARLDTDASQRTFRLLLEAFAHPGRIVDLGVVSSKAPVDPVLLPVLALADLEVRVHVVDEPGPAAALNRLIARSTGAPTDTAVEAADMVVATGALDGALIGRCRTGDAWSPEAGARLSLRCTRLSSDPTDRSALTIRVIGPGARLGRTLGVDGIAGGVFEALDVANADHPAGIDTWLIDGAGRCVGLPRSCRIELVQGDD